MYLSRESSFLFSYETNLVENDIYNNIKEKNQFLEDTFEISSNKFQDFNYHDEFNMRGQIDYNDQKYDYGLDIIQLQQSSQLNQNYNMEIQQIPMRNNQTNQNFDLNLTNINILSENLLDHYGLDQSPTQNTAASSYGNNYTQEIRLSNDLTQNSSSNSNIQPANQYKRQYGRPYKDQEYLIDEDAPENLVPENRGIHRQLKKCIKKVKLSDLKAKGYCQSMLEDMQILQNQCKECQSYDYFSSLQNQKNNKKNQKKAKKSKKPIVYHPIIGDICYRYSRSAKQQFYALREAREFFQYFSIEILQFCKKQDKQLSKRHGYQSKKHEEAFRKLQFYISQIE